MTRYYRLADIIGERIEQGLYQCGQRLPSVRSLSQEHEVSISTVQQAYRVLEQRQLVEPRPKSGYFVSQKHDLPALPAMCRHAQRPVEISQWDLVLNQLQGRAQGVTQHMGMGIPDVTVPSLKPLTKYLSRIALNTDLSSLNYDEISGSLSLREQISRLLVDSGSHISPDGIMVTTGCHEALSIAIHALCQPGDIIAVDSPSFHGVTQILKGFGMKALEIPTDPLTGISLDALSLALEQWPIKAIQLTPNCNNPLGYIMPDAHKQALLTLAQRYDTPIIEDDVYADLAYHYPRPRTIMSFDEDGRVLLCSSFSKTLAPGLRVGWIAPGRYMDQVIHMKYIGTGATATQPQLAVAEFIRRGDYHKHLRAVRTRYQLNRDIMTDWICAYFPKASRVSRPQGGFVLWIEMPERFDSLRLNRQLEGSGIKVAVGPVFSASGKYRNCIRISYARPLTAEVEAAIKHIGKLMQQQMDEFTA
ncbi:aminotransferase-like domain-containing protein [Biostraticola tofi]|uniref:DNA-binding transcriptional MocR family regulator n=1 Tax=Biostraticola tofi TaxID=466109 RepID=A0A4V2W410_9GAMM|nr:PLP-dependent aminotransferase family protein [Biostraticola tofi]TCV93649.1 DNA-binding transcriptional MocR family regulator [Biostraticola tofi]